MDVKKHSLLLVNKFNIMYSLDEVVRIHPLTSLTAYLLVFCSTLHALIFRIGAVRISVGYMTTLDDCNCFLQFLIDNFLNKSPETLIENEYESQSTASITTLYIYPIKSCAGIQISFYPYVSSYTV